MLLERLNPTVKTATILIAVILLSFQYLVCLNLLVFLLSTALLLTLSHARPTQVVRILLPAFVAAFGMFLMGLYYTRGSEVDLPAMGDLSAVPFAVRAAASRNLHSAAQLATRLLAYAGLGTLFALSTDGQKFLYSLMHQCHLPPKFAYGILAAVHLLPNLTREYRQVKLAFRTRNAGTRSLKPVLTMLVNGIRWSESVAMAMESKGFCGEAPRTCSITMRVRWFDWVCAAVCVGGIALGMCLLPY